MSDRRYVPAPGWLSLEADERVLLRARPSRNLVLAGAAGGFVVITAGALPFMAAGAVDAGRRVTFALAVVVVAAVAATFLLVRRREYVLTSDRAAVAVGLRSKEVRAVPLDRVSDVTLEQGHLGRWANVGRLRFVTEGGEDLSFALLGDPHAVYERTLEYL